jgi:hypothetical protein
MRYPSVASRLNHLKRELIAHFDSLLSLGLKLVLIVGAILELVSGNWLMAAATAGVALVMFFPLMLGYRFDVKIPPEFELLAVVFVFASLFLGELQGYYVKYWWWDVVLHSASGLLLGIFGFLLVHVMNEHEDLGLHMKPSFTALFAFMFALGMGVIWEVFEFVVDQALGTTMQRSLADTMTDLIVDGIGAFVIAALGYTYLRDRESSSFLERWVANFFRVNRRLFRRNRLLL